MPLACRHLGSSTGTVTTPFGAEPQYQCRHPQHKVTTGATCLTCRDFTQHQSIRRDFGTAEEPVLGVGCPHPVGVVVDRYGRDAGIADLYYGAQAFLVLGGPSLKTMPLHLLSKRGVLILSVNNCPAALPAGIRPHVWLHTDPARKFHDSIWRDPSVLKIVPVREWGLKRNGEKCLRRRDPQGRLEDWRGVPGKYMPGVLGFERNTRFDPPNWLWEASINRGNDKESSATNGWPNTINTMFAALRLAWYLGIKTLYLIGADFRMESSQPYAFGQGKGDPGVNSNNRAYVTMCAMLDGLKPYFDEAGFEVYNCTPGSCLWTFPAMDFEEAIKRATSGFEEPMNATDWYTPNDEVRKTDTE